jgi:rRNA maturation endonuclease Nob1
MAAADKSAITKRIFTSSKAGANANPDAPTMKCPFCKKTIPADSTKCPDCGMRIMKKGDTPPSKS